MFISDVKVEETREKKKQSRQESDKTEEEQQPKQRKISGWEAKGRKGGAWLLLLLG